MEIVRKILLKQDEVFIAANHEAGRTGILIVEQDEVGGHSINLPFNAGYKGGINLDKTAGAITVINWIVVDDFVYVYTQGSGFQIIPVRGEDGVTMYNWVMYADSPNTGISKSPLGKKYVGYAYNKLTPEPSLEYSEYQWIKVVGNNGQDGQNGQDGVGIPGLQGEKGIDGLNGSFIHLAYADSEDGSFNFNQTAGTFIGTYTDRIEEDSSDYRMYNWNRQTGLDGIPVKGEDGKSNFIHIKYSDNGGITFTANNGEVVGDWFGTLVDEIEADSNNPALYKWKLIKGSQGAVGSNGINGTSNFFHVKYSPNANGNPMSDTPDIYIGTAVTDSPTAPNTYTAYTWVQLKGSQGAKGEQGIAGIGVDGKPSYLHIKYSNDGFNFTSNNGEDVGDYMGVYADQNINDSNNPADYKFSLTRGRTGADGATGKPSFMDYKGLYSGAIAYPMYDDRITVVQFGATFYKSRFGTGTIPAGTPVTDTSYWTAMESYTNIATNLLLANDAYLANLQSKNIYIGDGQYGWVFTQGAIKSIQTNANGTARTSLTSEGRLFASDVDLTGNINATSGNIGGITINQANGISAPNFNIDAQGNATFTNANISGVVNATSGSIGGFTFNNSNTGLDGAKIRVDGSLGAIWKNNGIADVRGGQLYIPLYNPESMQDGSMWLADAVSGGGIPNPGAGGGSLATLADVLLSAPNVGQALIWNGARWVNQNIVSDLSGYLPLSGGNLTGGLSMNNNTFYLNSNNYSYGMAADNSGNDFTQPSNIRQHFHWGYQIETYDGSVTGAFDSREGNWIVKGSYYMKRGVNNYRVLNEYENPFSQVTSANTLVQRNASSQIFASYFNTQATVEDSYRVDRIFGGYDDDGYIRALNAGSVQRFIGLGSFAYRNQIQGNEVITSINNASADLQVSKYLRWANYGTDHVIFDASQGVSPTGRALSSTNPEVAFGQAGVSHPVLMAWNGVSSYGVGVDNAKKWNGTSYSGAERGTTPIFLLGYSTDTNEWRPSSAATINGFLGINNGSALNNSVTGGADYARISNTLRSIDLPNRNAASILPQDNPNVLRLDFVGSASTSTGGNYAGVMTVAPWNGTTASTGDASYQLAFGSTAANNGGIPMLNIRKGIDSTWNQWYGVVTDGMNRHQQFRNTNGGTGFDNGTLELLSTASPVLGMHWEGVVASTIGIEQSGRIVVRNNPGNTYENFAANYIQSYGRMTSAQGSEGGFSNINYNAGHNNIWRLESAPEHGIGYFQGGIDSIGFHFGNRNAPLHRFTAEGKYLNNYRIEVANDGAVSDPYGAISVTRGTQGNYAYYGMTRAGQIGWGMGISTSNSFIIGRGSSNGGTFSGIDLSLDAGGFMYVGNSITATVNITAGNTIRANAVLSAPAIYADNILVIPTVNTGTENSIWIS